MDAVEFGFLVLAGIGAGLTGSIAGLASLVSYPALLATGIPPVTANITNTVALVLNSVGSVSASRPELRGQGRRLLPLAGRAVLGGVGRRRPAAAHAVRGVREARAVPHRRRRAGHPRAAAAARSWRSRARCAPPRRTGIRAGCRWARSPSRSTAATSAPRPASCCWRCSC